MKKQKRLRFTAAIAAIVAVILGTTVSLAGCSYKDDDVSYTVTFNSNGGSAVASQTVESGETAVRPADPTFTGYTFVDWYSDVAFSKPFGFETTPIKSNITLYAKWANADVVYYTVTFNTDGGSAVNSQRVKSGDKVAAPDNPTKSDNTFDGWFADAARTSPWNFSDNRVTADTVLYAKWTPHGGSGGGGGGGGQPTGVYTITLNANGGTLGSVTSVTTANGKLATLPAAPTAPATPSGQTFAGWFDAPTGGTKITTDTVFTGNKTVYAQWTGGSGGGGGGGGGGDTPGTDDVTATFNVTLAARKAGLSNPAAQTVKSNTKLTAPSVTRNGYTLTGWYVENGNTKWDFSTDKIQQNTTLFAKWERSGSGSVSYTPTMTASNTMYIHYLRMNGDYDRWSLWVWGSGAGTKFTKSTVDASGAVYAISMSSYGSSVNFKAAIIENGNWISEDGGNCSVTKGNALKVGESYHWFVKEGETTDGTPYLTTFDEGGTQRENLRASASDVNRSTAASLPKAATATTCDEMGVGYQIFVASFCDSNNDGVGDIRGIINKLDYLDGLNVDVLWLTPIQLSDSYHGYDCYDYYSIDPKFGTNADYRELVYKAHQRGIKVIMDLVVNHTSTRNEWFLKSKQGVVETVSYQDGTTAQVKYRDFYRWQQGSGGGRWYSSGDGWAYYSSFGGGMPELNYDCQAVRNAMTDVAKYWMNFGLDGFRMDAIKHIFMWDESSNYGSDEKRGDGDYQYNLTKNVEFFKEFNYKLKSNFPHCFLLGEQLDGNAGNVSPFYAGMDSLFDFCSFFNLPDKIKNSNVNDVANMVNYNCPMYNNDRGGRAINSWISSNHDIDRLQSQLSNEAQRKLYFAINMTLPGLSWIYYGDEIGLVGYRVNNETGDDGRRQSMKWTSTWQYKCTAITDLSLNNSTVSVAEQENNSSSLLSYVKALTAVRDANPTLMNGSVNCSNENGMLKITLTKGSETIVCYHNMTGSSKTVDGSGTALFGSANIGAYGSAIFKR